MNSPQINRVCDFADTIGNYHHLWALLLGKTVTHIIQGYGQVVAFNRKALEIRVDYRKELIIYHGNAYGGRKHECTTVRYALKAFINEFTELTPPLSLDLVQAKKQRIDELRAARRKAKERELEREVLLKRLAEQFEKDFLNAFDFYQANCADYILLEEFQAEKVNYVQSWIKQHLDRNVDPEQAAAIAAVENHVQVVARAGSGKTSTLVNRALFLQQHCGVAPNEMLILAFNRKAVKEIRDRLAQKLQDAIPPVMTFHALAYALVQPEGKILFDEPDGEQSKSQALQADIIASYVRDPEYHESIRTLLMARFRRDWERIQTRGDDKVSKEMLRYRRSLPREAIDGTYVKSFGEKVIANFLFEHDIQYRYERTFKWWDGSNYRPDFTLEQHNIVIEYFGLQGDPDYDALSDGKRRYWQNKSGWRLLEFFPNRLRNEGVDAFCDDLKRSLEACGVKCDRLSEDEIWRRIKDRPHTIDRFTKVVVSFIQRCRKQSLSAEELADIIRHHECTDEIEQQFVDLVQIFYRSYLARLQATGEEDFDGLMQKAAQIVSSGHTVSRHRAGSLNLKQLRYVFIDEYQDFSDLFHRLISPIRVQNPQAQFFCVGDDWQAINGFAGSDLSFYQKFTQYFPAATTLNITTNYRSAPAIVRLGNDLMQGLGTPARAHQQILGNVEIADLESFQPTSDEKEKHRNDQFTPAVLRLIRNIIQDGKKVVLLSRKNSLPWRIYDAQKNGVRRRKSLDRFLQLLRAHLPKTARSAVTPSTAHGYKGLEEEVVILLDVIPQCYPLLHPDWIFTQVLGDSIEQTIAEERRLFYVALTRAVKQVIILTERSNQSPFLDDLEKQRRLPRLNWSDYLPTQLITVKVGNQTGRGSTPTCTIMQLLKAEGYCWKANGWQSWCRTYSEQNFSIQQFFTQASWSQIADGVEVRFHNEPDETLAIYHLNQGQPICVLDHRETLNTERLIVE